MNQQIYFFSGTGNSLFVARKLAGILDVQSVSMATPARNSSIETDATTLIIVFPSYLAVLHGVPLIVERFMTKITNIQSKKIYAICTCGGYQSVNALPPLKTLGRIIRKAGGKLTGAFSVRLPMNNLDYDHIPIPINKDHDTMFRKSLPKIDKIASRIAAQKKTSFKPIKSVFLWLMAPLFRLLHKAVIQSLKKHSRQPVNSNLTFRELMHNSDISIAINENCNGCGLCARICPVHNIEIRESKPVMLHHCEMCFACDEWCPRHAIQHWSRQPGVKYHHPNVTLQDMLGQSKS